MFSRRKNRPLVLSVNDSNYAPAPNPNTLRPQPATGQKEEELPPQKASPEHIIDKSLPHPIQQLANTYNETKRPIPPVTIAPKVDNSPKLPTIINNYYYVQAPPPGVPIIQPYVDHQQFPPKENQISQTPPLQQTQPEILSHHRPRNYPPNESNQYRHSSQPLSPQNFISSRSPKEQYEDSWDHKTRSDVKRSPHREASNSSAISNEYYQQRLHAHRKSPSRVTSFDSTTSDSTLSAQNAYDSFVKKSGKVHVSSRSSPAKKESLIDNLYQRDSIYSSASISDNSRNKLPLDEIDTAVARIPNVGPNYHDENSLENEVANLSLSGNLNLMEELMKLGDDNINVHGDEIFRFFDESCSSRSSMTIEQLGNILYDPYHSSTRLSFKTLNLLLNTFSSKANTNEMDFRSFVKMCKFVKGCYVSFNYHDKRGNDHALDFDEFQLALRSNHIVCSDRLLAEIFQSSEALDFEKYVVAIILIRKGEKSKH